MEIDCSSNARLFETARSCVSKRTIKCNRFGRLYCIVLLLDNWDNCYNIYENEIVKHNQNVTLDELKLEIK